eukprot:evm.model.scf_307EXC.7 EVM.evm.TU.scf_307EXC.7   scf_307EXC:85835-89127(+)
MGAHGIGIEALDPGSDLPAPAKGRTAAGIHPGKAYAHGRGVLQSGPLPLPPAEACGVNALAAPLLVTPGCQESVTAGQATEVCCSALEAAVGPEAEGPTRNCLCVEAVWGEVGRATDQLGIPIQAVLDECNGRLGARVPYFQGEGAGLCAGDLPPSTQALPLPDNLEESCAVTSLAAPLLVTPGCQESVTAGQATEVCCSALEAAVGPEANATTRNCLCAESVWAQVAMATDQLGIPIREVIGACTNEFGKDIPFYQGPGVGKCSGNQTVLEASQEDPAIQMRNFAEWVSDLPEEPALYVSFIFAIPATIGVSMLAVIATQALLW